MLEKELSVMGAEIGATTSTFGYDESMERYLRAQVVMMWLMQLMK